MKKAIAGLLKLLRLDALAGEQQGAGHLAQGEAQGKTGRGEDRGAVQHAAQCRGEFGIARRAGATALTGPERLSVEAAWLIMATIS